MDDLEFYTSTWNYEKRYEVHLPTFFISGFEQEKKTVICEIFYKNILHCRV